MDSVTLRKQTGFRTGVVSFDFPSMPDVVELARSGDYYVNYSPVMPDGMHQYRGTKPLEIPLAFKLHAMDRTFCPYGALTLLQLAARLHSFVLPLTSDGSSNAVAAPLIAGDYLSGFGDRSARLNQLGASTERQQVYDASLQTPVQQLKLKSGFVGVPYPPVTCQLNLIYVAEGQPGIACIGYVRDVRVRLFGPWLRGPSGEYNLPSAGEYEFTFIHRPAHNNASGFDFDQQTGQFRSTPALPEAQAYATDVRNQFYNTRALVMRADYLGFEGAPLSATPKANDVLTPQVVPETKNGASKYQYLGPFG